MRTKTSSKLTLKDRLSRLDFARACRLLGSNGETLIRKGGAIDIDIDAQVKLTSRFFHLSLPDAAVTIELSDMAPKRLLLTCSECDGPCEHLGAAFSLVLEEKMSLGLSALRPDKTPLGLLSDEEVVERAIAERRMRSNQEDMTVISCEPNKLWSDYMVTNRSSGRTYRVALRGMRRGEGYCSCPDYRKNTLGVCKHIFRVQKEVRHLFSQEELETPYRRSSFTIHIRYGSKLELWLSGPVEMDAQEALIAGSILNSPVKNVRDLLTVVRRLEALGRQVVIYPDAKELIEARLFQDRMDGLAGEIRHDPAVHPLRKELLKVELLAYQLDGIAFAAQAGRAIIADDMGLGKTIQAIGMAELLARHGTVGRVLVVCPASVKAQWRAEIGRFCNRTCTLVLGGAGKRAEIYQEGAFFTICNYEQVLRDIFAIEAAKWDLIVLDEGQRIKNWEAKTSRVVKGLRSRFALVLSGTPLENRLDDLFSVVEFIDDRRLGPAFRFFNRHRIVGENGKVLGYRRLDELRERLAPVFLRRTRASVMRDLPPRSTEVLRVTPTLEQVDAHDGFARVVRQITNKDYLTEMDLLHMRKALMMCRMAADSTYLIYKLAPGSSSKLERIDELLEELGREADRKILLFSEWTTMLDLVEPLFEKHSIGHVRLQGSVPQKKRQELVSRFHDDPECRAFLTTNAGATGLNLQAANTVINVDLPWNPAVLEQRIARAHRMGQRSPVQVFLMVTEDTIEERMLSTLKAKENLSMAALDMESDVTAVQLETGIDELKRKLELLLGAEPHAPSHDTQKRKTFEEMETLNRKGTVAPDGDRLLGAALSLLSQMLPQHKDNHHTKTIAEKLKASLEDCIESDDQGNLRLNVTIEDTDMIENLANVLARMTPCS